MTRLTVADRIQLLLDKDSFQEVQPLIQSRLLASSDKRKMGDGVVTGFGKINGRQVFIYSQDFSVYGGSLGEMHGLKISNIMDLAAKSKAPIIGLIDSGGARIQEGIVALHSYGEIFRKNVLYSGVIPQISIILGPCAGGAVYSPALTDFVFMVNKSSQMFITGPKVSRSISGEVACRETLGGAMLHASYSGVCHYIAESEKEVFEKVRKLLTYLPQNNVRKRHTRSIARRLLNKSTIMSSEFQMHSDRRSINGVLPDQSNKPYDMKLIIEKIIDVGSFFEIHSSFARNVVVGYAKIQGQIVSIIANQPKVMAGAIDVDASDKIARFVRFSDSFHIPILTLVDVPGFIPGIQQEALGIIRHGAKILYAYAEATVPKITVIIRKAYGGAYVALNSKGVGADYVLAWPNSEVAVMGEQGIKALFTSSNQPNELQTDETQGVVKAAAYGMVDEIIEPIQTRQKVYDILLMLENKTELVPAKKHGNIPL